jgi:hypothetical protein
VVEIWAARSNITAPNHNNHATLPHEFFFFKKWKIPWYDDVFIFFEDEAFW